jgi:hypothetical protein
MMCAKEGIKLLKEAVPSWRLVSESVVWMRREGGGNVRYFFFFNSDAQEDLLKSGQRNPVAV